MTLKNDIYKKPDKWITQSINVDADTGEIISKHQTKNYKKIKTTKHVRYTNYVIKRQIIRVGIRELTTEWTKRGTQINLFQTD